MDSLSIASRGQSQIGVASALSLMTILQILGTSCVLALTALAPIVAADLGIGAHWIGYQISLIYFAGMFASAFAGAIVTALGTRRVVLVETTFFAVGLLCLGTGQLWLMVLASVLIGVGYGLNNPASSEILERVVPKARRNLIFSIKQSGVPVGAVVANLFLPALVLLLGGNWRVALLVYTLSLVGIFLAMQYMLPKQAAPQDRASPGFILKGLIRDQAYILRHPQQRGLAFIGGLFSACQLMVTAFAVVTLVDQGWSPVAAGSIGAGMHAVGAVGRISWGLAADRFGCFRILTVIGLIIGALSFSLVWLAAFPPLVQAGCFVALGFVVSGWNGVMLAGIAQTAPEGRVGGNTGAALVYTFVGVIIGPSVFAVLYGVTGVYTICFALVTLLGLIGALIAGATQRASRV
jgi:MFS family permease